MFHLKGCSIRCGVYLLRHVCEAVGRACAQVGFAGEGAPRHILRRRTVYGDNATLTHEEEVELMLRDIFTRNLLCQARHRDILVCESLVEPTQNRQAIAKVHNPLPAKHTAW